MYYLSLRGENTMRSEIAFIGRGEPDIALHYCTSTSTLLIQVLVVMQVNYVLL